MTPGNALRARLPDQVVALRNSLDSNRDGASRKADAPKSSPKDLVGALHTAFGDNHSRAVPAESIILSGEFAPDSRAYAHTRPEQALRPPRNCARSQRMAAPRAWPAPRRVAQIAIPVSAKPDSASQRSHPATRLAKNICIYRPAPISDAYPNRRSFPATVDCLGCGAAAAQIQVGQAVNADVALLVFLRGSLGAKRDRILDFAGRPKAHSKFLELLYHQLGELFHTSSVVAQLPDDAWALPAFRFKPGEGFGVPVPSLRSAYDEGGQNELVITTDARYGYWRDETYVDSEALVVANLSKSGPAIR